METFLGKRSYAAASYFEKSIAAFRALIEKLENDGIVAHSIIFIGSYDCRDGRDEYVYDVGSTNVSIYLPS